jgi:ComF family protein
MNPWNPTGARLAAALARAAAPILDLARDLERFAFPQLCPGCGGSADSARFLCEPCRARIPPLSIALCARCLVRGRDAVGCRGHAAYRVWPALVYEERAALAIHALKYGGRPDIAPSLAAELARVAPSAGADLVLPMPLHRARARERGYNQAALLAQALSRARNVPYVDGVLERVKPTLPQARLDPLARRANVAGAFRVRRPEWVRGRDVWLLDDVMTTGATFEACLERLIEAGARPIGIALAWAQ